MGKEKRFKRGLGLMTGVMLIVLLGVPVTAAPDPPEAADSPAVITMPQADDNYLEVGVEWVNDYPYCCRSTSSGTVCGNNVCDLSLCDDDAVGAYNRLGGCGWIRRFNYGDRWAWEEDFKGRYKSGGGTEYRYVDTVDLAWFSGLNQ